MLGISTSWWRNKVDRADSILDDVLALGLDGVELEYRITSKMYREMKPRFINSLPVFSIHNFFPLPEEFGLSQASGDLFLLSSTDADERLRAVKYTIKTIQHAHDLQARAVVLHLGRVDMPNPAVGFSRLYNDGKVHDADMPAFINEQRGIRHGIHQKNLDAALLSLEELNREAEKRRIFLGIENRYHFHEIPNLEEIGMILERFQGAHIGYWHDVGHARVQENLGILRRNELLEAYSEQMIGIHLHDVMGLKDHLAPGQGEIDFVAMKPHLRPSIPKILELNEGRVNREELTEGIRIIRSSSL